MHESDKILARNKRVLDAAVRLAVARGFRQFNRDDVAGEAGVSVGTVSHAFGDMDSLHTAVMREAVDGRHLQVVARGIAEGHPLAVTAPDDVKTAALATLAA